MSTQSYYLLTNAYYNFNGLHDVAKPYVGIGLGMNHVKLTGESAEQALAYQLTAGSKFKIDDNLSLFSDLRYTASYKGGENGLDYISINAGVSYAF